MTLICIFLLAALLCFVILYYTRPLSAHEKQQAALKRHRKWQEKERKKHISYWKAHGRVIRPMDRTRYGAWVDETKEMS